MATAACERDAAAVVVTCEFGGARSPAAFLRLRRDGVGQGLPPAVTLCVLHGGYARFFKRWSALCEGGYVPEGS